MGPSVCLSMTFISSRLQQCSWRGCLNASCSCQAFSCSIRYRCQTGAIWLTPANHCRSLRRLIQKSLDSACADDAKSGRHTQDETHAAHVAYHLKLLRLIDLAP